MLKTKYFQFLIATLIFVNLCSCSRILDTSATKTFQQNVTEILARHSAVELKMKCSREAFQVWGTCEFDSSSEWVSHIVTQLHLKDIATQDEDSVYKAVWESDKRVLTYPANCSLIPIFSEQKFVKVYAGLSNEPSLEDNQELKLDSITQFKTFYLYHRTDSNQVCIQAKYDAG